MAQSKKAKDDNPRRLQKEQLSIYLDKPQAKAIRQLSKRTGAPVNHYMREGVRLVLAKYKEGSSS